ncbi:MAG: hypothetical protein JW775_02685 [Candidatus Aminicenantes bacterium]|nr:hypothetical protein [Candidatus Aminicenantes bacterium]
MNKRIIIGLAAVAALGVTFGSAGQELPKVGLPVLTTSAGQSTDVTTLNIVLDEAGIGYDYCDVPSTAMVADGVGLGGRESGPGFHIESTTDQDRYPAGTPFKAVIFAIGASLKGMGASGLTLESEEARLKEVIDFCKKAKIHVLAVHIGGESKRGPAGSDNERMIDAVAPFADHIIVTQDSNKDGRFTKIAEAKGIGLTEVEYALGLVDIVKQIFE